MTTDVITATPEMPLHEIATLLEERHIKRVPIVNKEENLVGIVSRRNLIQVVATARPKLEITLSDTTIRQTLLNELKTKSWAHTLNLSVTVTDRVVDLWGYAQSDAERTAVRVGAEGIPGVVAVNDHLMDSPIVGY